MSDVSRKLSNIIEVSKLTRQILIEVLIKRVREGFVNCINRKVSANTPTACLNRLTAMYIASSSRSYALHFRCAGSGIS